MHTRTHVRYTSIDEFSRLLHSVFVKVEKLLARFMHVHMMVSELLPVELKQGSGPDGTILVIGICGYDAFSILNSVHH